MPRATAKRNTAEKQSQSSGVEITINPDTRNAVIKGHLDAIHRALGELRTLEGNTSSSSSSGSSSGNTSSNPTPQRRTRKPMGQAQRNKLSEAMKKRAAANKKAASRAATATA